MTFFRTMAGEGPVVISIPHAGRVVPPLIARGMTDRARTLPDTDHLVDELYRFSSGLGASVVATELSRYVVDLNRNPDGTPLYMDHGSTAPVPLNTFLGEPIYREGQEPGPDEVQERIVTFHEPYHRALRDLLERAKDRHGWALLWDAHSIRSRIPELFPGELPALNFGTAGGTSCPAEVLEAVEEEARRSSMTWVSNGRFSGGWITRSQAAPAEGIYAIQMEIAQSAYLIREDLEEDEKPELDEFRAEALRGVLTRLIRCAADNLDAPLKEGA